MDHIDLKDRKVINTLLISVEAILLALQVLMVTVIIFSFIPIKLNDFVRTLLPLYWDQVRPERDMLFYALFIGYSLVIQLAVMLVCRSKIDQTSLTKTLQGVLALELFWVVIEIVAVFKIILFNNPLWARGLLYGALGLSVLSKVFYPEMQKLLSALKPKFLANTLDPRVALYVDIGMPLVIVGLLYVPNIEQLLAHVFAWDNFFHIDFFAASPGWAQLKGLLLNVDTNTNYNVMIPWVWSKLALCLGGFDYVHLVQAFILGVIIYYITFYFLLRCWTKSVLISVFGVLLAIKLQMFHWGIWPCVWRYPSATALRHIVDVLVFFFLVQYSIKGERKDLWFASLSCGLLMAYSLEVGIYAVLGFIAYVMFLLLVPSTRGSILRSVKDIRAVLGMFLLPFVVAGILFLCVQGPSVLTSQFATNMMEFSKLFLNGWAALPVTDGLKDKQFFAFIMGFVIPATYVLTLLCVGSLCALGKIHQRHAFLVFVSVYGLGLFHYFIYRSGVTSYDAVIIPWVMIICYAVLIIEQRLSLAVRRVGLVLLAGGTGMALLTSYLFTFYPNVLNLGRFDYTAEVAQYRQAIDLKTDVDLITRLTKPEERVALVSSLETMLLIKANRAPYFYYFPLIHSVPLNSNGFKATDLITIERVNRTMLALEQDKPPQIFVERKLIEGKLPQEYYQHFQTLTVLLSYIQQHYELLENGQYVAAYKRRS